MDFQSLINSRYGIGFGLFVGRITPNRLGYWLSSKIANHLSKQSGSPMRDAVLVNQWVVRNNNINSEELSQAVNETFQTTARCQFDLYHNIRHPESFESLVQFSDRTQELLNRIREEKEGIVAVGIHTSNLDIGFIALSRLKLKTIGISVPDPGGGYSWQNDIREKFGFQMIPASKYALREAYRTLADGGTVITGIDRPIQEIKYRPFFFGRPAALPVFHVQMALRTNSQVYVASNMLRPDGTYLLDVSEPIKLVSKSNRYEEIMINAEAILEIAEDFIRPSPEQWAMYYPVWPEAINEIPI